MRLSITDGSGDQRTFIRGGKIKQSHQLKENREWKLKESKRMDKQSWDYP